MGQASRAVQSNLSPGGRQLRRRGIHSAKQPPPGKRRKGLSKTLQRKYEYIMGGILSFVLLISIVYAFFQRTQKEFPIASPAIGGFVTELLRERQEQEITGKGEQKGEETKTPLPEEEKSDGEVPLSKEKQPVSQEAQAESYSQLLEQLGVALRSQDTAFLSEKLVYKDGSGTFQKYPENQIAGFAQYMEEYPSERESFLTNIKEEEIYGAKKDGSYVTALPVIYFAITTDTDNTTVVVDTFPSSMMERKDTLSKGPLLPMVYKIRASNSGWTSEVSQDVEVKLENGGQNMPVEIKGEQLDVEEEAS